ncbi:MAG: hypothetical protein A2Z72_02905 [Omnitrophica bacterium RBG_13_46_9]|nr:MAG: hypothetical protein A2Z72_02905 [Omnitrophica bacterium RBG_13_46_9]
MKDRSFAAKLPDLSSFLEYSIWGIVFCLPFSKSLSEGFIILAIALFAVQKLKDGRLRVKKSPIFLGLFLYLSVNLLSVFWSVDPSLSLKALITKVLKYIILFYIIYDFIDSEVKVKRLLAVILASVLLITINGFIQQYITGFDLLHKYPTFKYITYSDGKFPTYRQFAFMLSPAERGYVTSSFPFPNDYSSWIITILPMFIALSFFDLKKEKIYARISAYASLAFLGCSLFLTKTRGAWIAFFIGILFLSIARSKKLVIWFFLIAVMFYLIMPLHIKDALKSKLSFRDRMDMWGISVEMIKDRPLRGFGLNTYFNNYKIYRRDTDKYERGSYAHNCYLQQTADVGIPGLLIFLYLLSSIFWYSYCGIRNMKDSFYSSCSLGIAAGLLNFCVYAFVDTNFYSLPLVTLFWFMTGFLFSVINVYEKMPCKPLL